LPKIQHPLHLKASIKEETNVNKEENVDLKDFDIDVVDFEERIVGGYNDGTAENSLPADISTSRSIIPSGTGRLRDFSYIAPEIPIFDPERCVACMECVTQCPDTAILAKVIPNNRVEEEMDLLFGEDADSKKIARNHLAETNKFYNTYEKKGKEPGKFGIFIDPTKCKGCAECVDVCGDHDALKMAHKNKDILAEATTAFDFYNRAPETPADFINERLLSDIMLADRSLLYIGGAGSCMGCGEASAIRMMAAATGFVHGKESFGIVASTGCNTVYSSTYPYNPFVVPWMNSLFENGPTTAMGVRARWDQEGHSDRKLWVIGGDGAMYDIGFQALSRMFASGVDVNVLVLDTQVYSNTGGQAATASFLGQEAKMSIVGKKTKGKTENRKELGLIAMMHKDIFVAQTTAAHTNHYYRAIIDANSYEGPSIVICYTTCQPEHGVADNLAASQARLAVNTRAFPLYIYDPRKGETFKQRLSLQGNPAQKEDWYTNPKTGEQIDFVDFARSEGRFAKQFDSEGKPSEVLGRAKQDRLEFWHQLQELAGHR